MDEATVVGALPPLSPVAKMSTRPCSALIHSDLLVPALPLVPRDGPSAGDALGSKISSTEQEERKSCSQLSTKKQLAEACLLPFVWVPVNACMCISCGHDRTEVRDVTVTLSTIRLSPHPSSRPREGTLIIMPYACLYC
ncbi:unnamed protein product [Rangifer tarandus platyrhynchus]|uniref:Uncharacterized protein n=1 Tax=Rangifer tarandus platyrhynchus TaxID=3082113 RepID=A0AC59ZW89_RANTA